MALGTYGIKRLSDVSPENVEIISLYTPSRESAADTIIKKIKHTKYFNPLLPQY
jgi:hypothetical protein